MPMLLAYIACADKQEAKKIAAALLEERLIGCANILDGIESLYWWEGKIESGKECLLFCKLLEENMEKVEKRARELHGFDVPCIAFYRAAGVSKPYLQWLKKCCGEGND